MCRPRTYLHGNMIVVSITVSLVTAVAIRLDR